MRNAVKATVDAYDGTVRLDAWDERTRSCRAWRRRSPARCSRRRRSPRSCSRTCATPRTCSRCSATSSRATTSPTPALLPGQQPLGGPRGPEREGGTCSRRTACSSTSDGAPRPASAPALTSAFAPSRQGRTWPRSSRWTPTRLADVRRDAGHRGHRRHDPGPGQVANEFAPDKDVRDALPQFTAGGAPRRIFGNLLTVPVEDGLIYVQPVYAVRAGDVGLPDPAVRARVVRRRGRASHQSHDALETAQATTPDAPGAHRPRQRHRRPAGGDDGRPPGQPAIRLHRRPRTRSTAADQAFQDGDTATWPKTTRHASSSPRRSSRHTRLRRAPAGSRAARGRTPPPVDWSRPRFARHPLP